MKFQRGTTSIEYKNFPEDYNFEAEARKLLNSVEPLGFKHASPVKTVSEALEESLDKNADLWAAAEAQLAKKVDPMWKYDEGNIISEIYKYCADTYKEHYASGKIESFEFIADAGHGRGFAIGNIIKYAHRYGKKNGHNKKDLMKIIHYAIMEIWNLERQNKEESSRETNGF